MQMSSKKGIPLEEAFSQLENTISKLESEDISLEESFRIYSEGMKMIQYCNDKIEQVEKKVIILDEKGRQNEF